ncbi:sigma-54 interaction domain-containing protein [Anaerobranca gottschalkii]|uniref:Arginine utilization regulatory protein n=1 Tax=Anaerobranca gottschalkii DSM 13577 TaxID=1120990 RepID=A0A1I0A4N9_9FIRM|nr:sigma 54-interacting transcriptional regulator [Anaerobranca gottschalkii]SES89052.1 arginine utilization regulatory protein [Anaerobranca gottschalkii DSM 13577]
MDFDNILKLNFENILNSIDEGIHIVDKKGETIFYNPTMARMEGMEGHQVLYKDVLAMFPSLTPETSTIHRVLKTKKPIYDQVQVYTNYKGQRIVTINTTVPLYNNGEFVGVLEISKDVTRLQELAEKIVDLQQQLYTTKDKKGEGENFTFNNIIGESEKLKKIIEYGKRAAKTDSSVLIYGETGTGKELFAQSIHYASKRKNKPFIAQNCAALPESLLEGILFGTVKGSFTGAVDRPGLLQQADGGTLLLDEINSMGLDLQAKLLRVLQDKKVRPIGGTKEIPVDVRIIATTNTEPGESVRNNKIRQDLYYRLAVVNIEIPPLRERRSDIILLTKYFIDKYKKQFNIKDVKISKEVMNLFYNYSWPGNVRELQHVIEGAINILPEDHIITIDILPKHLQQWADTKPTPKTLPEILEKLEVEVITEKLKELNGNISKTAEELGISRQNLQYKLKKYKISI